MDVITYDDYLKSKQWLERREQFLEETDRCYRCDAPKKLAELVYNTELHVILRQMATKDSREMIEALCQRCMELETLGRSDLRGLEPFTICESCHQMVWDYECAHGGYKGLCLRCAFDMEGLSPRAVTAKKLISVENGFTRGIDLWKVYLTQILWMIDKDAVFKAFQIITATYEDFPNHDYHEMMDNLAEIPSPAGYSRLADKMTMDDIRRKKLMRMNPSGKPN